MARKSKKSHDEVTCAGRSLAIVERAKQQINTYEEVLDKLGVEQFLTKPDEVFGGGIRSFWRIGQSVFTDAVITWSAAHVHGTPREDDLSLFLREERYEGAWREEFERFEDIRNKVCAHATFHPIAPVQKLSGETITLAVLNKNMSFTFKGYEPYRGYEQWSSNWEQIKELLNHSSHLCADFLTDETGEGVATGSVLSDLSDAPSTDAMRNDLHQLITRRKLKNQ